MYRMIVCGTYFGECLRTPFPEVKENTRKEIFKYLFIDRVYTSTRRRQGYYLYEVYIYILVFICIPDAIKLHLDIFSYLVGLCVLQ